MTGISMNLDLTWKKEEKIDTEYTQNRKQFIVHNWEKRIVLGIFLSFFMMHFLFAQNRATPVRETKRPFKLLFYYNNLLGIGLGGHVRPLRLLSLELLMGTESPINVIWTAPYQGNTFNFSVKVNLHLPLGFRLSCGWYAGYFDITRGLDIISQITIWQTAPTLAVGVKLPIPFRKSALYFELGSAFNLPTRIYRTFDENLEIYSLEMQRSASSMGSLFPFFSIQVLM
jgi:hypothetical protein